MYVGLRAGIYSGEHVKNNVNRTTKGSPITMHINLHFDCVVSPRPDNWRKITILLRHQSSSPLPLFSTLPLNKSVEMGVEVTESETISSARLHHITRPGGGDHCKVLCLRNFSPVFEGVCSQAPGQGGDGEWRVEERWPGD